MSYAGYILEEYFGISESRSVAKYGVVFSKSTGDPRHSGKGFCGLKDRGDASIDAKADARYAADHGFTKKGDMGQGRYLRAQLGKSSRAKDDLKLMAEGGNAENKENKKDWENITRRLAAESHVSDGRSAKKYGVVYSKSTGDPRHTKDWLCGLGDRHDVPYDAKANARYAADRGFTKKGVMGQGRYLLAHLGITSRAKDDLKLAEGGNADNKENKKDWEKITRPDGTETTHRHVSKLSDHNDRVNYWTDQGASRLKDIQAKSYPSKNKAFFAKRAMKANLMPVPKGGWDMEMKPK